MGSFPPQGSGGEGFSIVFKKADETINDDDTLTDDNDLQFPVDANGVYAIYGQIFGLYPTPANIKWEFGVPTGITGGYAGIQRADQITTFRSWTLLDNFTGGTTLHHDYLGVLVLGGTGGTFAFRWAQSVSDAGSTILKKGSWLAFRKLN